MTRLEVRNLPAGPLRDQLVEELGGTAIADAVSGDGWLVRFTEGKPARFRRFSVPVLFVDVEGAREAEVVAFVRRKTMRGGG